MPLCSVFKQCIPPYTLRTREQYADRREKSSISTTKTCGSESKKKVSGHCAKLPWELLLSTPTGFGVLLWINKSWFPGCTYLVKLSVRTTFPSGFYLAQYMLLKEKLRVLCYRIQPDILPDTINRFFLFM